MPNFQKFSRSPQPQPKETFVTLQKGGNFLMSRGAYEALDEPDHVVLLFDPDERVIGFRGTTADDPDGYPVHKHVSSPSLVISGTRFRTYWGIHSEHSLRCAATMLGGVLTIDLKEAIELPTTERHHRR